MRREEDDHRSWPTGGRDGAGRGTIRGLAVLKVKGQANREEETENLEDGGDDRR